MTLTDERLLAYADGLLDEEQTAQVAALLEADADARERLRLMRLSGEALGQARTAHDAGEGADPLEGFIRSRAVPPRAPAGRARPWLRLAAAVALLAIGLGGGVLVSRTVLQPNEPASWVISVMDYQALYSRLTLETARTSSEEIYALKAEMQSALRRDAPVPIPDLSHLGLEFRRGQILEYDGWPLVQLVYLPRGEGKPVAVCFHRVGKADEPRRYLTHRGVGAVQWTRDGLEFLVVAEGDPARLDPAADGTTQQIVQAQ